jgi:hypothetical protein
MVSALEQSGGAWLPSVIADTVEELRAEPGQLPIVLDPGGRLYR